ncbi:MAG: hypothetical protein ABR956_07265 [Terracidiphilus sp.]|jgi:hypothetical protein
MSAKRHSQWNPTLASPSAAPLPLAAPIVPPSAVLVFHGMGEEVRFETLSRAASLILTEAKDRGAAIDSVVIRSVSKDAAATGLLVRSELSWTEGDGAQRQVHVYEAYWAPLTAGKVTYWETISFLVASGWNGLRGTFFSGKPFTFKRWLFGEFRVLHLSLSTVSLLASLMALIGFFAATVAFAAYSLANAAKLAAAGGREGLVAAVNSIFHKVAGPWNEGVHIAGKLLSYFIYFPDGPTFLNKVKFEPEVSREHLWQAVVALLLWAALIYAALKARSLLTQYAGSLAAYLSPYKDSKFDELRGQIQQVGLDVANLIYEGFKWPDSGIPKYEKVVILGHSLGSVIAYDTLNAMINLDSARNQAGAPNAVVSRTRALITFGSPLDKTAFLFRVQLNVRRNRLDQEGELRETMVCAVQPLIADYKNRYNPQELPHGPKWLNLWSPMDIISGHLDYYDDPKFAEDTPEHIQNMIDPQAWIPVAAHNQYWTKKLLRRTVYNELF